MRWLICVVIIVMSLFIETNLNPSYMDKPYVVEYPCVIMEVPGIARYIMLEPRGQIIKEELK